MLVGGVRLSQAGAMRYASTMAVSERRSPRDSFIPKIAKVVERIGDGREIYVAWTDTLLGRGRREARFRVSSVHLFGSFARGAPLCGDVDLLVAYKSKSRPLPSENAVVRRLRGGLRGVQLIPVLESDLEQHLADYPEARPLWLPTKRNWRAVVNAIEVDPDAGRFERKTDALPVDLKRIGFYGREEAERAVDDIAAGKLISTWVPIEALTVAPEKWDKRLQHALERGARLGSRTKQVLPAVLEWLSTRLEWPIARRWAERCCMHFNDVHAHMGRPILNTLKLERIDVSTLLLAPHLSTDQPNGIWVIERGASHETVAAFKELGAWVESENGRPVVAMYGGERLRGAGVELWRSESSARRHIKQMSEPGDTSKPMLMQGRALLDLLAKLDLVMLGEHELRISGDAADFAKRMRALLAPKRAKAPRRGTKAAAAAELGR